jgi:nicotinate phosphoribosyltransferase
MAGNEPRLKISENMKKVTLPGNKQVFRVLNGDGLFYGADVVAIEDEKDVAVMHHPFEKGKFLNIAGCEKFPLLNKVMQKGEISIDEKSTTEIAKYANSQLNKLPQEYKRFENPHIYKIGLSDKLNELRNNLWDQYRK